MSKTIVVSGYYGYGNFGDELILRAILQNLSKSSLQQRVIVLSGNAKHTVRVHGVEAINRYNVFSVFSVLKKADELISGGGGLLQDKTSKRSLVYYLLVILIAQVLGKKTIIYSQGIGPINSRFLMRFTSFVLSRCSEITVRDEDSLLLLSDWGIKARLAPDPVFTMDLPCIPSKEEIRQKLKWKVTLPLIGVVIRDDYPVSKKIRGIIAEGKNYFFKLLNFNREDLNLDILKVAAVDCIVSMRLHPLIVARRLNIPTIGIKIDPKIKKNSAIILLDENFTPTEFFNALKNIV